MLVKPPLHAGDVVLRLSHGNWTEKCSGISLWLPPDSGQTKPFFPPLRVVCRLNLGLAPWLRWLALEAEVWLKRRQFVWLSIYASAAGAKVVVCFLLDQTLVLHCSFTMSALTVHGLAVLGFLCANLHVFLIGLFVL